MSLISPGIEVKVINETLHLPASLGTIPSVFVASAENKMNASGTGTAIGTLKQNAEKPMLISSQRELADLFGDPLFYTDTGNNPLHAGELNEYGLQSAYSFLGANNRVWVTRADLDLSQLVPSDTMPSGNPFAGTVWLDTINSDWGIFEWDKQTQKFNKIEPYVLTEEQDITYGVLDENGTDGPIPKATIGTIGSYAIVFGSTIARIFTRNRNGVWVLVGSKAWQRSEPVYSGNFRDPYFEPMTANLNVNGTEVAISFGMGDQMENIASSINAATIPGVTAGTIAAGNGGLILELFVTEEAGSTIEIGGDTTVLDQLGMPPDSDGIFRDYARMLQIGPHTKVPAFKKRDPEPRPTGSVWVKTTPMGGGANWITYRWNSETNMWDNVPAPLYESREYSLYELDRTDGGAKIPKDSLFVDYNVANDDVALATFKMFKREAVIETAIRSNTIGNSGITPNTYNIQFASTAPGSPTFSSTVNVSFTTIGDSSDASTIAGAIAGAGIPNVTATVSATNNVIISHTKSGEFIMSDDSTNPVLNMIGFSAFVNSNNGTRNLYYKPGTDGSNSPLVYQASSWAATIEMNFEQVSFYVVGSEPDAFPPNDGQLWYHSAISDVDILINTGTRWVGYHNYGDGYDQCNPTGPMVTSTMPTTQIDGSELVTGDIWIDTSDLENYPIIRRYDRDAHEMYGNGSTDFVGGLPAVISGWELVDTTDQTTENGIVFADARSNVTGMTGIEMSTITELLNSDYVDYDCPDPVLYPRGCLLWNTRRSGYNVKKYVKNHVDTMSTNTMYENEPMLNYFPGRWVTASPNKINGAGSFGRSAQRSVVVNALKGMLASNEALREVESRYFNLMATPGYPEVISDMISLNIDRQVSSFIIGDSPARLQTNSTKLYEWLVNEKLAPYDNDDGLVSSNEYLGVYYPWGLTTDNNGNDVMVPPSHMMLRTIAENDSIAYPWFAPAGTRRGRITNASSVGYLTNENEYLPIALNDGQRDVLYENNVNPIVFMNGVGLIAHGQKTRAGEAGALDRINVSRLVIHLRRQLELVSRPYIYQPNDKLTRNELSNVVSGILLELMGQRAIYDFLVVCDESNNTNTRISRNEIWVDVAIEPTYTAEFIYIPLRLKSPGTI